MRGCRRLTPSSRQCFGPWMFLCGALTLTTGCATNAERGALFGGLLGAGTGAIVGNATGSTLAGTAIGAGVGALAGSAIGDSMDEMEARNRAMIAQQLGREVYRGQVTFEDVIAMSQAGVNEELIINHIRINGAVRTPTADDIIRLQREGVSANVIKAMQEPPIRRAEAEPQRPIVIQETTPPPVVIYERDPYWWGPPPHVHYRYYHYRPGVSWGVTVRN